MTRAFRNAVFPYLLITPGFLFITVFTVYPAVKTVILSFRPETAPNAWGPNVGLEHYVALWNDEVFRQSLGATFTFMLISALPAVLLAFVLALWLHTKTRRLQRIVEFAWIHPMVLPAVGAATLWLFIFTPQYGLLAVVSDLLGLPDPALLRHPETALWALAIVEIWRQTGYYLLFFLAGLSAIPEDVEEAAKLDGADGFRLTLFIRLPLLWPTMVFVGTVSLLHALQTIDPIFIMTQGGPNNATNLLLYQMYLTAFFYNDWGKAAATAVVFLLIAGLFAGGQVYGLDRLWRSDHDAART